MKTLTIALLTFFSLSSYAMLYNKNMADYIPTSYTSELAQDYDSTRITVANSEIMIVGNDSSVNVQIADNSTEISNDNNSFEEFEDVNVEVIEGINSTRIMVHKDGDTIKNYEMNYDFQAEGKLDELDFDGYSLDDKNSDRKIDTSEKNEKSFTFPKKRKNRFKGHWSGFEFGLNNYVTEDFSVTPDESYMEINTGKSWNFNLNFAQFSVPIARDRLGLVSGLGLEWNNYHFANNNTITKDPSNHIIKSEDLSNYALKKNRLQTTYLTAPLLMEVQLGRGSRNDRTALSGGVIAGLKLGSHTKYKSGDGKQKMKDDFYLQSFRYGFTARVHYDFIGFYFNYYKTPLFVDGKGPELYPFAAGLVVSFD
ncbi:MAG: hypothetical protein PF444_04590 [Bacteroidales bacterium]|jgi:hypothetical protein|nr:hypothetical protein [Bacteroidales bacterium]